MCKREHHPGRRMLAFAPSGRITARSADGHRDSPESMFVPTHIRSYPASASGAAPNSSCDEPDSQRQDQFLCALELRDAFPGPCSSVFFVYCVAVRTSAANSACCLIAVSAISGFGGTFSYLRRSIHFIRIPTTSAMPLRLHQSGDARLCAHRGGVRHRGQPGAGRGGRVVRAAGFTWWGCRTSAFGRAATASAARSATRVSSSRSTASP